MWPQISKFLRFAGYVVQYGCLSHVTFEYLGDIVIASGESMEPTLYTHNWLLNDRLSCLLGKVQRGDIIVAKNPRNPQQYICKRVLALPGDKIKIQPAANQVNPFTTPTNSTPETAEQSTQRKNHLDEDEQQLDAGTLTQRIFSSRVVHVPRGHVWIEGDNAANSMDSREFGPIPIGLIRSRVLCRIWPPTELRWF